MSGEAVKHDQEKVQLDLLSASWIFGVGEVLTFGAKKYAAHNWRAGLQRSRLLGATLRHVFAYLRGEDFDSETGLLHLYHASCCLMFASELHETRPDLDDRWKPESAKTPYRPEMPAYLCKESPLGDHKHDWDSKTGKCRNCSRVCGHNPVRVDGEPYIFLCSICKATMKAEYL